MILGLPIRSIVVLAIAVPLLLWGIRKSCRDSEKELEKMSPEAQKIYMEQLSQPPQD